MKTYIGVDLQSGLVHTVVTTAANGNDVTQAYRLLHDKETEVFGDAGYQGIERRKENPGLAVKWFVALWPGKQMGFAGYRTRLVGRADRVAQVEHPSQGRAYVPHRQEAVWSQEKPQFGIDQEHSPVLHVVCAGQSDNRQAAIVRTRYPKWVLIWELPASLPKNDSISPVSGPRHRI